MPTLTIDGMEITVDDGTTVMQAAEDLGIEIPRFCYHERLSITGSCRMCLVEMERAPKPIASCSMPAGDGMVIHTNTPAVKKAREGVMELLLVNHPLDCPICDQGGECDLQDQAMAYGRAFARYDEVKRAVKDKFMGPLIKTAMTRCIHCTRCVRFVEEIAGIEALGAINRGEHMEITSLQTAVASEMSGNLIDLCPVGALTSKPYAFTARPWELRKTESIDAHDAVGSNIRIDTRGREVMRVLPRLNEDVNEEWLADKSRFAVDGLKKKRLDRPWVRRDGNLQQASWDEAFAAIAERVAGLDGGRIGAIAGDMACGESMMALSDLMDRLGSANKDCRQDGAALPAGSRAGYLFNTTIAGIEQADVCLLIGTNPRREAPLVNARLRKRWRAGDFKVAAIGEVADLTFPVTHLGAGPDSLKAIADGSGEFANILKQAERPMLIVGQGALARGDGAAVLAAARSIAEASGMVSDDWNGFNVLHTSAARVGGMDLGFVPGEGGRDTADIIAGAGAGEIDLVFLLGADEIDMAALGSAFVVYLGSHGDAGAHRADVILPGAAYTEKDATWVNTEGRVQLGRRALFPPGDARDDWTILRALSGVLGQTLPYDDLPGLRARMREAAPHFAEIDAVAKAEWGAFGSAGAMDGGAFRNAVSDYYQTNPISRASETMAKCSAMFGEAQAEATGTHG